MWEYVMQDWFEESHVTCIYVMPLTPFVMLSLKSRCLSCVQCELVFSSLEIFFNLFFKLSEVAF